MKFSAPIISTLLATAATARPRTKTDEEGPLDAKSRVTAFVIDNEGNPSVECWEITSVVDSMKVKRKDGSEATSQSVSLAGHDDLESLDIITWPTFSDIWPPANDVSAKHTNFDLSNNFNLFNIQGGLINFNFYSARFGMASDDDDDEVETHIFSLENGDDWFYFEDSSSDSAAHKANSEESPFHISTISATETELLRLRYAGRPHHKVVHKGACSFTGIRTSSNALSGKTSRTHSPLSVQVNIEDL